MINKRNIIIVCGIFVFAAVVGGLIGFANRVIVDPVVENDKLVNAYHKNKDAHYVNKNQEVIRPEKNTPIGRIPKVQIENGPSVGIE